MGQRRCDSTSPRTSPGPVSPPTTPTNPPPDVGTQPPEEPVVAPIDPDLFSPKEDSLMLEAVSPSLVADILTMVAKRPMWVSLHYAYPTFGAISSTELTGPGYRRVLANMEVEGRILANVDALRFNGLDVPVTVVAASVNSAEVGGVSWALGRFNPPRQLVQTRSMVIGAGEIAFRMA